MSVFNELLVAAQHLAPEGLAVIAIDWTATGGHRRTRQTSRQAAMTLRHLEDAEARLLAEEACDDPIRMIPYILDHKAVEGRVHTRPNAYTARQFPVPRRHAPGVALRRGFLRSCERGPEHDRIGSGCERFTDIAAVAHPAVGDDRDVPPGVPVVLVSSGCAVDRGRYLWYADAKHLSGSADRSRPHSNHHPGDARFH